MSLRAYLTVAILVAGLLGPLRAESADARSRGVAMEGTDEALIQLPVAGWFEPYRNHGYELRVEQGRARVRSTLEPLVSRDPFALPALTSGSEAPLPRLARSLAAGSTTRHEAASRILGWVATNIRYELLRGRSQEPEEVLARRSGYCTGVARLTTGLLGAIGIPAREVPGYVVSSRDGAPGYHRWIEVFYEDRGWVFSDPLVSHHYVPATYVPLASENLLPDAATETGVLLWRADHRRIVDRTPLAPAGVSVRRNKPRQLAGTLEVELPGVVSARAELRGRGSVRSQTLTLGRGVFLDLEPGTYVLSVEIPDRETVVKRVVFRGPVVGTVTIPPAG